MNIPQTKQKKVQAVERTLSIMEILAKTNAPMSLSDISYRTHLNISTTHRLLSTLILKGFAEQEFETGKYKLGLKTFEIGNAALYGLDIRGLGRPYLDELVKKFKETANLYVYNLGEVILIEQVEPPSHIKMALQVGSRLPTYCTSSGKVFLASLNDYDLNRVFKNISLKKLTRDTIADVEVLRQELFKVRKNGFAQCMDEMEEGVSCWAVPIWDYQGRVVAALSILGPTNRLQDNRMREEIVKGLKEAGESISFKLGYIQRGVKQGYTGSHA